MCVMCESVLHGWYVRVKDLLGWRRGVCVSIKDLLGWGRIVCVCVV